MVLNLDVGVDTDNEVVSHSLGLAKGIKVTLLQVGWKKNELWSVDMWTCSFQLVHSSVLQPGCKDEQRTIDYKVGHVEASVDPDADGLSLLLGGGHDV